jgi:hypothetical protein
LLQAQVRVLVLPGRPLSNTRHMVVKLCQDKLCPVKDCLAMACLALATASCQEVQVGTAVDKRLKLADGIKANLKAMVTGTRATRAR